MRTALRRVDDPLGPLGQRVATAVSRRVGGNVRGCWYLHDDDDRLRPPGATSAAATVPVPGMPLAREWEVAMDRELVSGYLARLAQAATVASRWRLHPGSVDSAFVTAARVDARPAGCGATASG